MATGIIYDPENPPADGTPAALRAKISEKIRQMPAGVDHNGSPVTPKAAPEPATVPNAADFTDPALALSVIKAAEGLGIDYATATGLLDSRAFVDQVANAAPDEIAAAITARVNPAPRMAPNPAQGHGGQSITNPPTFRDKMRGTLDRANGETYLGPRAF